MFKKARIIKLSSGKVLGALDLPKFFTRNGSIFTNDKTIGEFEDNDTDLIEQYLYVLSNDKIKKGDWYMWMDNKAVAQTEDMLEQLEAHRKAGDVQKIIATTDTSIIYHEGVENLPSIIRHGRYGNGPESQYKLPTLSPSFIQEYCHRNGIDEVMVEYDEIVNTFGHIQDLTLKVASDNTITIRPVEVKTYTAEEVMEKLDQFHSDLMEEVGGDIEYSGIDHFIEIVRDNLE